MTYEVQKVRDRHHEIIRLTVLGLKDVDIAERTGTTPQNVRDLRKSPLISERVAVLQTARNSSTGDVQALLEEEAPLALDVLREVRDNEEHPIHTRIGVAKDLLDRAGYSRIQKSARVTRDAGEGELSDLVSRVKKRVANVEFSVVDETPEGHEAPENKLEQSVG